MGGGKKNAANEPNPGQYRMGAYETQKGIDTEYDLKQNKADRPTQITPQGNVTWKVDGDGNWTQTTSYAKPLNAANDIAMQNTLQAQKNAQQSMKSLTSMYQKPIDYSKTGPTAQAITGASLKGLPNIGPLNMKGLPSWAQALKLGDLPAGAGEYSLNGIPEGGKAIAPSEWDNNYGTVGPADQALRDRMENELYSRQSRTLDPQYTKLQNALENRLAQQGLALDSEAYKKSMEEFGRNRTDAYGQARSNAIVGGGQEMALQQGMDIDAIAQNNATRSGRIADLSNQGDYAERLRKARLGEFYDKGDYAEILRANRLRERQDVGNYNNSLRSGQLNERMDVGNYNQNLRGNKLDERMSLGKYNEGLRSNRISELTSVRDKKAQEYAQMSALGEASAPTFSDFNTGTYTRPDYKGTVQGALGDQRNEANAKRASKAETGKTVGSAVGGAVAIAVVL